MTKRKSDISRREFLETTGAVIAVATATPVLKANASSETPMLADDVESGVPTTAIRIVVNGTEHKLQVEDRWTLAEVLRDHIGLTGTKIGCDRGECGACTVLLDGKPVYSCSNLAVWVDGREIQTVEGLAHGDELDPLQQAFVEHDGPQCGFCTSGQLMSAKGLLSHNPHPTAHEVQRGHDRKYLPLLQLQSLRGSGAGRVHRQNCRRKNKIRLIDSEKISAAKARKKTASATTDAGGAR